MERTTIQPMPRKREVWLDNVKVFACIAVLLSHLIQGLNAANIFSNETMFRWFNQVMYAFHVPLFLICSGYLYQKYNNVRDWKSWKSNAVKKALDLGVPYISFTTAVWLIKKVIPGSGNNEIMGLWENLLLEPIPPYWYLYTLLLCFLVTPTFRASKKQTVLYIASIVAMLAGKWWIPEETTPGVIRYFVSHYTWFLAGMRIAMLNPERIPKAKWIPPILIVCFLAISYRHRNTGDRIAWLLCSFLSCSAVIFYNFRKEKQGRFVAALFPYTMPVFLMHSIFIAVCRILLLKCGITNLGIHLVMGAICGMGGPIVVAKIMKKLKYPELFLYPRKFIKLPK